MHNGNEQLPSSLRVHITTVETMKRSSFKHYADPLVLQMFETDYKSVMTCREEQRSIMQQLQVRLRRSTLPITET